ncbi:DUF3040 domain-containing protein [Geodermatophilus sp. SYSU D01176]
MVEVGEEVAVLSDHEQRVWDDIERFWAEDAEEPPAARMADVPPRSTPRTLEDAPVLVIGSFWAAVLLVLFGVHAAGLALFATAALGSALWRYWPLLSGSAPGGPPPGEPSTTGRAARWPREKPWRRRLRRRGDGG